jgi:16S rRNA processing protein RimM
MHLESWTDPPAALFGYPGWQLRTPSGARTAAAVADHRVGSGGLTVRLEGVETREQAELWVGCRIEVPREALPPTAPGEHYRHDLLGFRVFNLEGVEFGVLERFEDLPANAVMVVKGERERWLPVTARHLRQIDPAARRIVVDWPEDF